MISYGGGVEKWRDTWEGNSAVTGGTRDTQEWVLAPNTSYVFRLTSDAGTGQAGLLQLVWYEHTDG